MNRNNIRENKAGKEMELNQNQEKLKEYPKTWDKGVQLVEQGTARCGKSGNGNRISTGNRNGCYI